MAIHNRIYDMLKATAEAKKAKALLTFELFNNHPAGIGDHTTGDFYKNCEEALQMYIDAKDELDALEELRQDTSL
jgi:hypothetical protein